jgi:hypothetical protein
MDQKATAQEARRVVEGGDADRRSQNQQSQKEGPAAYAPLQPLGPYNRDPARKENPELDDVTVGDQAQAQREKRHKMQKAEGDS